jgi:hypothetical protein
MATEVAGPPKAPATIRAATKLYRPWASPPSAVPNTKPAIATARAFLRSKRSKKRAPTTPATAAAAV